MTQAINSIVPFKFRHIKAQSFLDTIEVGFVVIGLESMLQNSSLEGILRITKVYIIVW